MKQLLYNEEMLYALTNELSKKFFDKPFRHHIKFNHRLRTTGGRYILKSNTIELNPKYVVEMDKAECIGIIKHELCHYHLHIEGKGYKHGDKEFKALLKVTGSPRHCKPLPSSKDTINYIYICKNCNQKYHRKRKVNVEGYSCGKCRGKISLKE